MRLTEEQIQQLHQNDKAKGEFYTTMDAFSTKRVKPEVTDIISKLYAKHDKKEPTYIFVENPTHAKIVASALNGGVEKTEKIYDVLLQAINYAKEDKSYIDEKLIMELDGQLETKDVSLIEGNIYQTWLDYSIFCKGFGVEIPIEQDTQFLDDVWINVVMNLGYMWNNEEYCVLCDRVIAAYIDENYEFHKEDGPAIIFRGEGSDVYMLNGVKVTKQIVMEPETISVDDVLNEVNAEVKRIMMEQMGIGKYLELSGAKLIDGDMTFVSQQNDDRYVPRALLEDKEGRKFMVGTDGSTHRVYHMQVPEEVKTVSEAASALAGFSEDDIIAAS
jgi:hypothetical protein